MKNIKQISLFGVVIVVVALVLYLQYSPRTDFKDAEVELIILGTIQDAGSPHIACMKDCCRNIFLRPVTDRKVVSLGVLDHQNKKSYLFEATPDMPSQLKHLKSCASWEAKETPQGVFLTHAHIGHYSGLMYFGKEAMNASEVKVYAMPRMRSFLQQNGPWSLLVENNNISLSDLNHNTEIELSENLGITPIEVPHRDEFSETVGYRIEGPNRSALFIPDIDKWSKWNLDLETVISTVDFAFIDGTFYDGVEINHRDISQIPHPFIIETLELLSDIPDSEKEKVHFIHFNHTNPVLNEESGVEAEIEDAGFKVAKYGARIAL
ncbi:MAG: MBL fold metallo-hydrolase [Flavobacteriales bacterium]|jgi:pyrroloquinoline quinone biosynthesis protein B|tara:strand:- start:200 stop:1165 length:966 start_codon:yes stop_codon:yes gene_type:complete